MKTLTFAILCILASANAFAASLSWNGSVSNLWSVAANWTPAAVPQSGDTLTFGLFANTMNDKVRTLLVQPTSVTAANSPSTSVTGQPVTVTATVTGSGPMPTGTVS